jgi:A/G-specific adenine glycosylase
VKLPKKQRKIEEKTVFILSCDGKYALRKRPKTGLLAGLWEFPNVPGKLELPQAMAAVEAMGLKPRDVFRQVSRGHIFTHVQWDMLGIYLEVAEPAGAFTWMTAEQIRQEAALPTAFRQFWE